MASATFFVWHPLLQTTLPGQFHVILLNLLIKGPHAPHHRGGLVTQGVQCPISWATVIDPEEDTWPKHGQSGFPGGIDVGAES